MITRSGIAIAVAAAFLGSSASSEVSYRSELGFCTDFLVTAPLEESDSPSPQVWTPFRQGPGIQHFNPTGATSGDGPPSETVDLDGCRGAVVWAHLGSSHNVFFQEWTAAGTFDLEIVAATSHDELDPSVALEPDGTAYVTWWQETLGVAKIYLITRIPGEHWSYPEPVICVGQSGRRPSIGVLDAQIHIAWESDTSDPSVREIRVSRRTATEGCPAFVSYPIATTTHVGRLDPIVHVEGGRLWVDWKHSTTDVAFAEYVPATRLFTAPLLEVRQGPSWVGVETARARVRRRVLDAQ